MQMVLKPKINLQTLIVTRWKFT